MVRLIALLCFGLGCGLAPYTLGTAESTDAGTSSAATTWGTSVTGTGETMVAPTGDLPGSTDASGDGETRPSSSSGFVDRFDSAPPQCDFETQDCPEGQKCVAHSPDPNLPWSTFICVPVVPNPDKPGEPCTATEYWSSGVDTCDKGATCWHLNNDHVGHCLPNCSWDTGCAAPDGYCRLLAGGEFAPMLCFTSCHPLVQDCPDGKLCSFDEYWGPPAYSCYPDTGVVGETVFDDCTPYAYGLCAAGLACLPSLPAPCSQAGCCLPYCDLTAPECSDGLECAAFLSEGQTPPPGFENIAVCLFP